MMICLHAPPGWGGIHRPSPWTKIVTISGVTPVIWWQRKFQIWLVFRVQVLRKKLFSEDVLKNFSKYESLKLYPANIFGLSTEKNTLRNDLIY